MVFIEKYLRLVPSVDVVNQKHFLFHLQTENIVFQFTRSILLKMQLSMSRITANGCIKCEKFVSFVAIYFFLFLSFLEFLSINI